jgi:hypothetical protein
VWRCYLFLRPGRQSRRPHDYARAGQVQVEEGGEMEQPSPLVSTPSCRAGQVSVARLRSSSASASYLVVVSAEADDAGARGNPRHRGVLSSVEKAGIGLGCWDGGGGGIVDGAAYLPGVMRGWAGAQGDGDVSAGEGRAWWLSPQWMAATTGEGRSAN